MKALTFILEATRGCNLGCHGCSVQKDSTDTPSAQSTTALINLMEDLRGNGVELVEIEVGPTDIFSAKNGNDLMESASLQRLYSLFDTFSVSAAFIYPDKGKYEKLAKQLSSLRKDIMIGVAVPLEPKHLYSEKYMGIIAQNLTHFYERLGRPVFRTAFNIIFDSSTALVKSQFAQRLFDRAIELQESAQLKQFRPRIDFVLHHGRVSSEHSSLRNQLPKDLELLHSCYMREHNARQNNEYPRFLRFDDDNHELVWHNENIYVRPCLNDRATFIDPLFAYRGELSAKELISHYNGLMSSNIAYALDYLPECAQCSHVAECASRFIHDVMRYTGAQSCITYVREYEKQQNTGLSA